MRQASERNFNPRLIFSQIVSLQCFHYFFLGIFFQINHVLYKQSVTIDRMFTDEYLRVWHGGWQDALAVFLSYAVVGYVYTIAFYMKLIIRVCRNRKECDLYGITLPRNEIFCHYFFKKSHRIYSSFLMAIIVEKSKKCLDFSFTLFIVHLLIVCVYDGFPSTWDWWIVHICSVVTMVLLGEYLCARREMEDIPLLQL